MDATFGSVITVLAFLAFVGIVAWAYGKGRKRAFDEAANAPFALPDEINGRGKPRQRSPDNDGDGARHE